MFVDFGSSLTMEAKVDSLAALTPPDATVVAHSAGAVPVVLAIAQNRIRVSALVLAEPALYDVARGAPEIERHIEAMTAARRHADAGDLRGFWEIVRPVMFGAPADSEAWGSERELATRFASAELPWGHHVTAGMIADVPTLVVTGGWNAEYEAIASALVAAGAAHITLTGNEHRPQDHPDFERTVRAALA